MTFGNKPQSNYKVPLYSNILVLSFTEGRRRSGHRRSQDFVCGGALFTTQQKLPKIDSCSAWGGALSVLRGCTYTFFL